MRIWLQALGALGALCGAFGVGLAAAGAHLTGAPAVTTAAYFLLFHAAAILALCGLARRSLDRIVLAAATMILAGTAMFSGDLALRGLAHIVLVHMMAPTGGMVLILGWLLAAAGVARALGASHFDVE